MKFSIPAAGFPRRDAIMYTLPTTGHQRSRAALRRAGLVALGIGWAGQLAAVTPQLELQPVVSGLDRPVALAIPDDGSGRLFIAEQSGRIQIFDGVQLKATPFLDISDQVLVGGERGLLGFAFHPDIAATGHLYLSYTDTIGTTVISSYTVSANPDIADPDSEQVVLLQAQPAANHNGGNIVFGPDGYLYIGLGDGGGAGDPGDNAQDPGTLLGKMLRIDVDGDDFPADPDRTYSIPADNPFVGEPGVRDEIWALGLRNPWRFSFDRVTGDLLIGDVGQASFEEVDLQPAGVGGANWGWRCYEGIATYDSQSCGPASSYDAPILIYDHSQGCSITGGYRYRGTAFPNLYGTYLYADYCSGTLWGARNNGSWSTTPLLATSFNPSTFGESPDGELYIARNAAAPNGTIYRIVDTSLPGPFFTDGFEAGDTASWTATVP